MKKYLNEIINELPTNCLFDKGKPGCGGTSLAIECDKPYVICVPFASLVDNKVAQYPNERRSESVLGVYKGVCVKNIKDYVKSVKTPKIIVTYDSLYKVVEAVDPKEYNLLVDEYHLLFNHYSFRKNAIQGVLKHYNKFNTYMFMTATPLEEEFLLDELKDIPIYKQEWEDVVDTKVQIVKCDNVEASTIKLIKAFINGRVEGNAYLFVNSVDFIKGVIKKVGLTEENTRVIYSPNNKTKVGIKNSVALSDPKKINFLTSTVFEGSDIYDENGRIIIISDPSRSNTLLDISTSIQQIAGRIRNSKYINCITHLFKTTRYVDISYEEFKERNLKNIEETKNIIEEYNNLSLALKKKLTGFTSDTYVTINDDLSASFDPNMAKIDIFNFKVSRGLYAIRTNLSNEYLDKGFNKVEIGTDNSIKIDFSEDKKTFKEIVEDVKAEYECMYKIGTPVLDNALISYPWLKEAIEKLGFERISSLKYVQKDIKNELLKVSDKTITNKVVKHLSNNIQLGMWYSLADIKKYIAETYKVLGINNTAKATELTHFYDVKETQKRINGKHIKGYVITGKRFVFK